MSAHPIRFAILLVLAAGLAGCGGNAPAGEAAGGMPPMPVEVRTVAAAPVEQTSEYIAQMGPFFVGYALHRSA